MYPTLSVSVVFVFNKSKVEGNNEDEKYYLL